MTHRVRLVPCTVELLEAELRGTAELCARLGVRPAPDWPPTGGEYDADAARFFLSRLRDDPANGGWQFYVCAGDDLVASAGFFGPPDGDGTVEIGYSVGVPFRGRGVARSAVAELVRLAQDRGARRVVARTRADNAASIAVLRAVGFTPTGVGDGDDLLLRRELVPDA